VSWTIELSSRPGVAYRGRLEQIEASIDRNQHTALVTGRVENPKGELKAQQAVTVTLDLPAPAGEIELPIDAVVEDGRESVVFRRVESPAQGYQRVPVQVVRRFRDGICIRSTGDVKGGDRLVTSGALLLHDAMDDLPVSATPK
jgi:cobalt-zinc-cadmium efflux system membrane fusion protein